MAKENISLRLEPWTLEFLRDVTTHGLVEFGEAPDKSQRVFLEWLIKGFILRALGPEMLRQVLHAGMSHEQLVKIWLKYRKAERGEPGYQVYRRPKTAKPYPNMVVAVFGPDSLP